MDMLQGNSEEASENEENYVALRKATEGTQFSAAVILRHRFVQMKADVREICRKLLAFTTLISQAICKVSR